MMINKLYKVAGEFPNLIIKSTKQKPLVKDVIYKTFPMPDISYPYIDKSFVNNLDSFLKFGIKINDMEIPVTELVKDMDKKQAKSILSLFGNPDTVVVSAKANTKGSGFSIASLIGKKGDKTVSKGAVSVSHYGEPDAVLKFRLKGNRKKLQANGFVDAAQTDLKPLQADISKANGKLELDYNAGSAASASVKVDAKKAMDILPDGNLQNTPTLGHVLNAIRRGIGG